MRGTIVRQQLYTSSQVKNSWAWGLLTSFRVLQVRFRYKKRTMDSDPLGSAWQLSHAATTLRQHAGQPENTVAFGAPLPLRALKAAKAYSTLSTFLRIPRRKRRFLEKCYYSLGKT